MPSFHSSCNLQAQVALHVEANIPTEVRHVTPTHTSTIANHLHSTFLGSYLLARAPPQPTNHSQNQDHTLVMSCPSASCQALGLPCIWPAATCPRGRTASPELETDPTSAEFVQTDKCFQTCSASLHGEHGSLAIACKRHLRPIFVLSKDQMVQINWDKRQTVRQFSLCLTGTLNKSSSCSSKKRRSLSCSRCHTV
jgi:hypothetical protein